MSTHTHATIPHAGTHPPESLPDTMLSSPARGPGARRLWTCVPHTRVSVPWVGAPHTRVFTPRVGAPRRGWVHSQYEEQRPWQAATETLSRVGGGVCLVRVPGRSPASRFWASWGRRAALPALGCSPVRCCLEWGRRGPVGLEQNSSWGVAYH